MAGPRRGPCDQWTTKEALAACDYGDLEPTDDELTAAAFYSSRVLYVLSGRKYPGACTDEVHPCVGVTCNNLGEMYDPFRGTPSIPVRSGRAWRNVTDCEDCHVSCIKLAGPIIVDDDHPIQVWVDGEQLASDEYLIQGNRKVCRVGAEWPMGSDPTLPKEAAGSFAIVYYRGRLVPDDAQRMARIFGQNRVPEFICNPELCNKVLEGADSVSADGVSINLGSLSETRYGPGRVGIQIVDEWLRMENPKGRRGRTKVGRADDPARKSRRWT